MSNAENRGNVEVVGVLSRPQHLKSFQEEQIEENCCLSVWT